MSGEQPHVITLEPLSEGRINPQEGSLNYPPGLVYLTTVSNLFIKQNVEMLEAFTGIETQNRFTISNQLGEQIYYAAEKSDSCAQFCGGPGRPFEMKVVDTSKNEIIYLNRPFNCSACCFPSCFQEMEVFSPPGTLVGTIEQDMSIERPRFTIKDAVGNPVLLIVGPCYPVTSFGSDLEFKVLSNDGEPEVGKISKKWSGLAREFFTDADFFGVSFLLDLDVRMKAVMIGAVFLIDMMFFET